MIENNSKHVGNQSNSRNRENTQNTSLNRSACYINMEVISNNNEPPRYNQIPITTIPTTTMLSPPRSSDNNTERLHEEPPPSYDTVIESVVVQLGRNNSNDRNCGRCLEP